MSILHIEGFDWAAQALSDFPGAGQVRASAGHASDTGVVAIETTNAQYGFGKALSFKTNGSGTSVEGCPGVLFNLNGALQAGHHVFVGFAYQPNLSAAGGLCEFVNGDGDPVAGLGISPLGYLKIFGPAGDSGFPTNPPLLGTDNAHPLANGQYYYVEVEFFVNTAAGKNTNATCVFKVWVNNVLIFNYTGGLQVATPDTLSSFDVTDFFLGACDGNATNNVWTYGGPFDADNVYLIVGDSTAPITRLGTEPRIDAIYPTSSVTLTGYSRTGGTGVSDAIGAGSADGDTSYYKGLTVDDEAIFDSTDTLNGVPTVIHGVGLTHLSRKVGSGTRGVSAVLNDASTDFVGAEASLTTDFGRYQDIWTVRPSDSAAWGKTTVEAVKIGVKITT